MSWGSTLRAVLGAGLLCFCSISLAAHSPRILHMGQLSDPYSLNPFQIITADSAFVASNLFEGLVVTDANGAAIPGQASDWRIESDGHRAVFTLRPGLQWSNGEPLTAQDFVAGFRYLADPANGFMMATQLKLMRLKNIEDVLSDRLSPEQLGVSAPDERTVVLDLDVPVGYLLPLLSTVYPLHQPTLAKYGESWARVGQMVVNGAYQATEWVINERLRLTRNPRYWQDSDTRIDEAILYPLAPATEFKQYEVGALDMTATVLPGRADWLKKKYGEQLRINPVPGTYFYILNLKNPKLQQKAVRQALADSIDKPLLTDKVLGYQQKPSRWFVPEESLAVDRPAGSADVPHRKLQKQPLPNNGHLQLEILYNTMDSHRQMALAVSDMWKRHLGVTTTLRNVEWNTLSDEIKKGEFEVLRLGWAMGHPHPCFLYVLFKSDEAVNQNGYHSEEFDQTFDRACYHVDANVRHQAQLRLEEILADDMPAIPIYSYTTARLISPRVQGFPRSDQYPFFRIQDLSLTGSGNKR